MSKYGTISQQDFRPLDVGGENGTLAPDPKRRMARLRRFERPGRPDGHARIPATGWEQNVDPVITHPGTIWRNTWTLPLAFSPVDRTSLYFGHQNIFRSRNGGETWSIVSPDLSRANEGTPSNLDRADACATTTASRGTASSTRSRPRRCAPSLVWAGTDDGYIWVDSRRLGRTLA